jgi:hypothetical protein
MKRIMLSHLQMLSLVLSLAVPWPELARSVLEVAASAASFGPSNLQSIECLVHSSDVGGTHGEFVFLMLLGLTILPLAFSVLLSVYWFLLAPAGECFSCGVKMRSGGSIFGIPKDPRNADQESKSFRIAIKQLHAVENGSEAVAQAFSPTSADIFVSSVVLLWYLSLPSLLRIGTMIMDCTRVGEESHKLWLALDLEEPCWEGRHLYHILAVALPMMVVYGIVFPLSAFLLLQRARDVRLTNPSLMLRFGLLYSGFRQERFWWELVVLSRKYSIIAVSTLVDSDALQVHLALGIIIVSLHLHGANRPFGKQADHRKNAGNPSSRDVVGPAEKQGRRKYANIHGFEMWSLLVLMAVLWCAVLFFQGACAQVDSTGAVSLWCSLLTFLLLLANGGYVFLLGSRCFFEWGKRNKLFSRGRVTKQLSSIKNSFQGASRGGAKNEGQMEFEVRSNPLANRRGGEHLGIAMVPMYVPSGSLRPEVLEGKRSETKSSSVNQGDTLIQNRQGTVFMKIPKTVENPSAAAGGIELVSSSPRRRFVRHETEDGEEYFVEVGGESVWELPTDAELVVGSL